MKFLNFLTFQFLWKLKQKVLYSAIAVNSLWKCLLYNQIIETVETLSDIYLRWEELQNTETFCLVFIATNPVPAFPSDQPGAEAYDRVAQFNTNSYNNIVWNFYWIFAGNINCRYSKWSLFFLIWHHSILCPNCMSKN